MDHTQILLVMAAMQRKSCGSKAAMCFHIRQLGRSNWSPEVNKEEIQVGDLVHWPSMHDFVGLVITCERLPYDPPVNACFVYFMGVEAWPTTVSNPHWVIVDSLNKLEIPNDDH
jgi:hypothetical protein